MGQNIAIEKWRWSAAAIANDAPMLAVSTEKRFHYDGEAKKYTDQREGTLVNVLLPGREYTKIQVMVPTIRDDLCKGDLVKVEFPGFSGMIYVSRHTGDTSFTAKADDVIAAK